MRVHSKSYSNIYLNYAKVIVEISKELGHSKYGNRYQLI